MVSEQDRSRREANGVCCPQLETTPARCTELETTPPAGCTQLETTPARCPQLETTPPGGCTQLETTPTYDQQVHDAYRLIARHVYRAYRLGEFAYAAFDHINAAYFDGRIPETLILWQLTDYGRCLGWCRS